MIRKKGNRPKKYKKAIKIKRPVVDMEKEIRDETDSGKYDKNIGNRCCLCGRFIGKSLKNYLERGNCCENCNAKCRTKYDKKEPTLEEELKDEMEKGCNGDCINCKNYNCLSNLNITK